MNDTDYLISSETKDKFKKKRKKNNINYSEKKLGKKKYKKPKNQKWD